MRNLKSLLLIAVFTLGLGGVANAQKIAHIDFQKLITEMPASKKLKTDLEKLEKTWSDEVESQKKKVENLYRKYSAEQNSQTKEINELRAKEVQQEEARFQQLRQTAVQEMQKKQEEGLQPIVEKARKAIDEVAAAKGILYVLDANSLLVKKGEDIYDAVKAKLGF